MESRWNGIVSRYCFTGQDMVTGLSAENHGRSPISTAPQPVGSFRGDSSKWNRIGRLPRCFAVPQFASSRKIPFPEPEKREILQWFTILLSSNKQCGPEMVCSGRMRPNRAFRRLPKRWWRLHWWRIDRIGPASQPTTPAGIDYDSRTASHRISQSLQTGQTD